MIDYKNNVKTFLKNYFNNPNKKISQRELAAKLEVNETVVSKWIKDGDNAPTLNYLPPLAEALGVTLYELFGIDDKLDDIKALELYKAYLNHPEHQASINQLLGIK